MPQIGALIKAPLPALRAATAVAPVSVSTMFHSRLSIEASRLALSIEAPRLAPLATTPGPDQTTVPVSLPALLAARAETPSSGPIMFHSGLPHEASHIALPIEAPRIAPLVTTPGSDRPTVLAPLPAPLAAKANSGRLTMSHSGTPFKAARLALPIEATRLAPPPTIPGSDQPTVPVTLPALLAAKAGGGSIGPTMSRSGVPIKAARLAPLATIPMYSASVNTQSHRVSTAAPPLRKRDTRWPGKQVHGHICCCVHLGRICG
jgi:hypothetical protein